MVVADSSPLIYFAALSDFHVLRQLFHEISIPRAVFDEVVTNARGYPVESAVSVACESWIVVHPNPPDIVETPRGLHAGEDAHGVRHATDLGILVLRTTAIFRLAKQRGLIPALAPRLAALREAGFYLRDDHYQSILRSAGEL